MDHAVSDSIQMAHAVSRTVSKSPMLCPDSVQMGPMLCHSVSKKGPMLCQTVSKWPILCQPVSQKGPYCVSQCPKRGPYCVRPCPKRPILCQDRVPNGTRTKHPCHTLLRSAMDVHWATSGSSDAGAGGGGRRGEDGGSRCPNNRLKWNPQAILGPRGQTRAKNDATIRFASAPVTQ